MKKQHPQTSDKHAKADRKKGFTLIELSIVLVIIGLIVGGVLVGQDLIHAAEIRATVAQLEKYNSAVNTFRTKYNGMPGDLVGPANFGMTATDANNKGNGLIESCLSSASDGLKFGCETAAFWNHLSTANLIDGSFTSTTVTTAFGSISSFSTTYAPPAKLGRGNFVMVGALGNADTIPASVSGGLNYFFIDGPASVDGSGGVTIANTLSPIEASNIDAKIDDAGIATGIVQAFDSLTNGSSSTATIALGSAATDKCQNTSGLYNIAVAPTTPLCDLAIRTSF